MARTLKILAALAKMTWREMRRFNAILGNNFFAFAVLLFLGPGGAFIGLILAALVLFPLCADPMRKLSEERFGLWPITGRERRAIRLASVWLSPAAWIAAGAMIWGRQPWLLLLALGAAGILFRLPEARLWRGAPGAAGEMFRKDVRQLLSVLDPYLALVLSLCGSAYRFFATAPDPDAFPILALLVVLAFSTYGQCLFSQDGASGMARYRLLPVRGWRVLLTKHLAFLAVVTPLVLPLAPLPGVAAALVALALGNAIAVPQPRAQPRWTFSAGSLAFGVLQSVALFGAGIQVARESALWLAPCVAVWVVSVAWYGWRMERVE